MIFSNQRFNKPIELSKLSIIIDMRNVVIVLALKTLLGGFVFLIVTAALLIFLSNLHHVISYIAFRRELLISRNWPFYEIFHMIIGFHIEQQIVFFILWNLSALILIFAKIIC
jgi:hypothetical protein